MKASAIKKQIKSFKKNLEAAFNLETDLVARFALADENKLKERCIIFNEELARRETTASNKTASRMSFTVTYLNDTTSLDIYDYLEKLEELCVGQTITINQINAKNDYIKFTVR